MQKLLLFILKRTLSFFKFGTIFHRNISKMFNCMYTISRTAFSSCYFFKLCRNMIQIALLELSRNRDNTNSHRLASIECLSKELSHDYSSANFLLNLRFIFNGNEKNFCLQDFSYRSIVENILEYTMSFISSS